LPLSPFGVAGAATFELMLTPFQGKRSVLSVIQLLKCFSIFCFFKPFSIRFKAKNRFGLQLNHPTKGTIVIREEAIASSPRNRGRGRVKKGVK
jgi:hypothetical protein